MEKFLNSKGIEWVEDHSDESFTPSYAYNLDMLDKDAVIECYSAEIGSDPENPEVETVIFLHIIQDDISYSFTMFYEYGISETAPLQILRIITDLVEYINICNDEFIIDNLAAIAKGIDSSLDRESEADQAKAFDIVVAKLQYVRERLN